MSKNDISTKLTVKPSGLLEALRACDAAALTPFILSPPGIGKTEIGAQFAKERAKETGTYSPIYLGQHAPTDLCGFPYIDRENNRMRFSVPSLLPSTPNSTVVLDEFSNAPAQNQNLALQIAHEKRIGEWVAPENTMVILSGNGQMDRCHTTRLSSAMANRVCFLNLVPDLDDWCEWALGNGVDVRIAAFLKFRPDLLHTFEPGKWDGESGYASPRSWAAGARLVASKPPQGMRAALLEGLLGSGPAVELQAFLQVYESLPDIRSIEADPMKAKLPGEDNIAARYAVCAAIANHATPKNFGKFLTYLGRLPKELEVFGVRLGHKSNKSLCGTKEFFEWAAKNEEVLL